MNLSLMFISLQTILLNLHIYHIYTNKENTIHFSKSNLQYKTDISKVQKIIEICQSNISGATEVATLSNIYVFSNQPYRKHVGITHNTKGYQLNMNENLKLCDNNFNSIGHVFQG